MLWKENYRPYGDKFNRQAPSSNNRIGYHGKPYDDNTGMSYMGSRYYDPLLGRFLGMDPVDFQEGNLHSFNRYAYANNNPYKFIDPDGKYAELAVEAFSLAIGIESVRKNLGSGNYGAATVDAVGVFGDALLATVPGAPGVLGLGIKASREGGEAVAKAAAKGTTGLGKFAGESIPARSAARDFTVAERAEVNAIGSKTGCQTCGTTNPGTKSGNFVPDHQPPSSLNATGEPQRLYPQCINCSREQGLEIARQLRKKGE